MVKSLLEKAKTVPQRHMKREFTKEDFELVIAWFEDDISMSQLSFAKGFSRQNAYVYITSCIKYMVSKGFFKIIKTDNE